jgi:hypothetical protein
MVDGRPSKTVKVIGRKFIPHKRRSTQAVILLVTMTKRESIVKAETEGGQIAGEAIVEAVENQLRDNNPPAAKQALKRLMALGESRENAIRYIASVLSVEIYEAMKNHTPYKESRYISNLNVLPKLPFDDED